MNTYISSNSIIAYPAVRRQGVDNKNGTLLTESRLSSIVNSLLDTNGFVTYPLANTVIDQNTDRIELNILGRYFKILTPFSSMDLSSGAQTEVYVGIKIDSTGSSSELYDSMIGGDTEGDDSEYEALKIFSSVTSDNGDNTYQSSDGYTCVKVAEKVGDNWVISEPEFSKVRFIDCGELD